MMWGYGEAVGEIHKKEMRHTVELQQYGADRKNCNNCLYGEMSGRYRGMANREMFNTSIVSKSFKTDSAYRRHAL